MKETVSKIKKDFVEWVTTIKDNSKKMLESIKGLIQGVLKLFTITKFDED